MKLVSWLALVLAAVVACSDDDAEPMSDAGPDGSAGKGDAGGMGGSRAPNAGRGGGGGSGPDPCADFPLEDWPLGPDADGIHFSARRLPLDVLCPSSCVRTLADFEAALRCVPAGDDAGVHPGEGDMDGGIVGLDAGISGPWVRSEGCGTVQFVAWPHPRVYDFDADTGELIGYARLDDAPDRAPGSGTCLSAGWVAGTVRGSCAEAKVSECH